MVMELIVIVNGFADYANVWLVEHAAAAWLLHVDIDNNRLPVNGLCQYAGRDLQRGVGRRHLVGFPPTRMG